MPQKYEKIKNQNVHRLSVSKMVNTQISKSDVVSRDIMDFLWTLWSTQFDEKNGFLTLKHHQILQQNEQISCR